MLNLSFIFMKFFSAYFKDYCYLTNSSIVAPFDFKLIVYLFNHSLISNVLDLNKFGKTIFN